MYLSKVSRRRMREWVTTQYPVLHYSGYYKSQSSRSRYYFFDLERARPHQSVYTRHDVVVRVSDHGNAKRYGLVASIRIRLGQSWEHAQEIAQLHHSVRVQRLCAELEKRKAEEQYYSRFIEKE